MGTHQIFPNGLLSQLLSGTTLQKSLLASYPWVISTQSIFVGHPHAEDTWTQQWLQKQQSEQHNVSAPRGSWSTRSQNVRGTFRRKKPTRAGNSSKWEGGGAACGRAYLSRKTGETDQPGWEWTDKGGCPGFSAFLEPWVVVRYQNVNMLCKLSASKGNERNCCRPGRRLKPSPSDSAHLPALALLGPQR